MPKNGIAAPSYLMLLPFIFISIPTFIFAKFSFQDMVEVECRLWANKGININYEVRENRRGYKAGALKEGMEHSYVQQCEFVAIFDSDFQPEPDFLMRTVPFMVHNSKIALVQARWQFGKPVFDLNIFK